MDFLPKSQRSNSTWEPINSLKGTHTTCFQKNTGRESEVNWANRINKDFYDLTYDVKFSQSKGKQEFKGSPGNFRMRKKFNRIKNDDLEQQHIFDKNKFRLQLMAQNKSTNPEQIYLAQLQKYSTLKSQGLCKFQFDKTIAGRLKHRKNLHLDFNTQTGRQLVTKSLQQSLEIFPEKKQPKNSKLQKMQIKFRLRNQKYFKGNKCHDFDSYDIHQVFSPKFTVQRFYQTLNTFKMIRPNNVKQTVKISKLTGRRQQRPRQSSILSYDEYQSKKKTMRSPTSHQFSKSPRKFSFERQVILSKRGCYR